MPFKVLLLNPPGERVYIRDYYCSKVSKSNYCPHPVDLLVLSGRLAECCEVHLIDAIADRLDPSVLYQKIEEMSPDVVISLIGDVSIEEDCSFLAKLSHPSRRIVVSGDAVLEAPQEWLRLHPYIDAVLLDFTGEEIVSYLAGVSTPLWSVVTRGDRQREGGGERPHNQEFSLPPSRHEMFNSQRYSFPFVRHREFATVLTDYGCPYSCSFCNMSGIGYKFRPVSNVMEELRLIKRLGKKEIFFIDQSFGADKARTLELCSEMNREGLDFGWVCFSRVDLLTEDLLDAMHDAGCHTVMLGVETADESMLLQYRKGFSRVTVREAFKRCKAKGIRTVATFILGLPEETWETACATIEFAKELDPDFVSFNVAVPRGGTPLRQEAINAGLVSPGSAIMDQSGTSVAMPTRYLTKEQVQRLRRKAMLEFYLRPGYLWRKLTAAASPYELKQHLAGGWEMLKNIR
jgi:radical SAM superfamily enzyme YgiQ (UPF0313 family)